ncbi:hypothetical protein GCM10022267_08580 [Lentzea roselyniae]|uniref:ABM domain-containing protein n=1 Tax=Lentzea roselyniae TaxID=531940 RepID=A0ABP7A4C9_9PSEU
MYIVAHHRIKNPEAAFQRGRQLISGERAPEGVKVLQFHPSQDLTEVTCLWESDAVAPVQGWVDSVLGDASENHCYPGGGGAGVRRAAPGLAAARALTP